VLEGSLDLFIICMSGECGPSAVAAEGAGNNEVSERSGTHD